MIITSVKAKAKKDYQKSLDLDFSEVRIRVL